jgi:pyruvate carboxylase subunit B
MTSDFIIHHAEEAEPLHTRVLGEGGEVEVNGRLFSVELAPSDGTPVRSVILEGRSLRVIPLRSADGRWAFQIEGVHRESGVYDRGQYAALQARKAAAGSLGPPELRAPMPGLVVRVEVEPGMVVQAGQGVVIIEAMKMENELRAVGPARVRAVHAKAGLAVEKDTILVEFESLEDGGEG